MPSNMGTMAGQTAVGSGVRQWLEETWCCVPGSWRGRQQPAVLRGGAMPEGRQGHSAFGDSMAGITGMHLNTCNHGKWEEGILFFLICAMAVLSNGEELPLLPACLAMTYHCSGGILHKQFVPVSLSSPSSYLLSHLSFSIGKQHFSLPFWVVGWFGWWVEWVGGVPLGDGTWSDSGGGDLLHARLYYLPCVTGLPM